MVRGHDRVQEGRRVGQILTTDEAIEQRTSGICRAVGSAGAQASGASRTAYARVRIAWASMYASWGSGIPGRSEHTTAKVLLSDHN